MTHTIKNLFVLLILVAFTSLAHASENKFASAHTVALDGVITEGYLYSKTNSDWRLQREIKEQLMYTIGQLNGLNGGAPDMNRLKVSISNKVLIDDGTYEVTYSAKLFIAWPKEQAVPENYLLILPAQGDSAFLKKFTKLFGSDENSGKKCLDGHAHEVTSGLFWYYYRPAKSRCALRNPENFTSDEIATFNVQLTKSEKNTVGKFPEYGKVWEDGKLVVTAIFGLAEESSTSNWDAGASAYSSTVNSLVQTFGQPIASNINTKRKFSNAHGNTEVNMTFKVAAGELDVSLFLIKGIRVAPTAFRQRYNERTLVSDYVSYSGHSGLGANIRSLAQMGEFAPEQYQIFLINGCDTFAYVDDALRNAHQRANPEFGKDKFIDVITNAMPSYFHMNKRSNMAIINALVGQTKTYEQILAGFDRTQRAAVTGEEDNAWPEAFLK